MLSSPARPDYATGHVLGRDARTLTYGVGHARVGLRRRDHGLNPPCLRLAQREGSLGAKLVETGGGQHFGDGREARTPRPRLSKLNACGSRTVADQDRRRNRHARLGSHAPVVGASSPHVVRCVLPGARAPSRTALGFSRHRTARCRTGRRRRRPRGIRRSPCDTVAIVATS